ncbi:MAG: excisionase family DNA-binding protein [Actinomycetes bacterium]
MLSVALSHLPQRIPGALPKSACGVLYMAFVSVAEAAHRLGVSPARVHQRIADGSLPAVRVGRQWAIDEALLHQVSSRPGQPLSRRAAWAVLAPAAPRPASRGRMAAGRGAAVIVLPPMSVAQPRPGTRSSTCTNASRPEATWTRPPTAERCGQLSRLLRGRGGGTSSSGIARSMNLSKCGTVNSA